MNIPAQSKLLRRIPLLGRSVVQLRPDDVKDARAYIREWWHKAEQYHPKSEGSIIGLPHPYIVPSFNTANGFNYEEQYYWDTYFIVQGLLDGGEHSVLARGMLENLLSLFKRFGVIPDGSRTYLTGRSQPPLLTSLIFDIYEASKLDKKWLERAMNVAQQEHENVWMGTEKPNARQVHRGLSRYYDINLLHDLAETESGWDMTSRFNHRALEYLPVDLNALLYKYETDFAKSARLLDQEKTAIAWEKRAHARAETMYALMWDHRQGLYYDYNYVHEHRSAVASLAAYFPMWAGMVDQSQAAALVRNLRRFEYHGGLAATEKASVRQHRQGVLPLQWVYPNGWAPLHLIVIEALERYGFHADAHRIAMKWLGCNLEWFKAHGEFLEKYNVVRPSRLPRQGVYPTQNGFGWTNAVFERLCRDYIDNAANP